jgi:hypothetical protein
VLAPSEATPVAPAKEPRVLAIPEDRIEDPREQVEWFGRLPEHAKEELRERWRGQEGTRGDQKRRRKDTTLRWILEGGALLLLAEAVLQKPTLLGLALASAAGAAVGWAGALLKPGALRYGVLVALVYAVFGAVAGSRHMAYYVISLPIIFGVAAALGTTHRVQRFDGTEL